MCVAERVWTSAAVGVDMKRFASLLLAGLAACATPAVPPATDAGVTLDVADASPDLASSADAASDQTAPADVEPTECEKACAKYAGCAALPAKQCVARCAGADPCGSTCVTDAKTCEDAADCLGAYAPLAEFSTGPFGSVWREIADEVELPLADGPWSLEKHFNGRDSYVFFLTAADFKYAQQLWKSSVKNWLKGSPHNVHYFFLGYANKSGDATAQPQVDAVQKAVTTAIGKMDAFSQCLWTPRIHFVQDPVQGVGGPLLDLIQAEGGVAHVAIDRFQRWRQIGLLSLVGASSPDLALIDYEVRHWNFEWDREQALAKQQVTLIPVHNAKDGAGFDIEIDFPPAAEMAKFDTMQFDLNASCKDHKDENCAEWDYISRAYLCERVQAESAKDLAAACTPAAAGIAADTQACTCTGVDGQTVGRTRTCKADGKAFGPCQCGCPLEIGRWITPYHREGRWVSDATPFLALIGKGGKQRISLDAANFPMVDFTVRLSNQGKGVRPVKLVDLFGGGGFGPTYNDKYKPLAVDIPSNTKKVGLFAFITGHGWGAEKANCAEFCNHTHHFGLNGTEFVKNQPVVGQTMGCAEQVDQGTVPNQFGTWNLGRGGWCPGLDVKPFDVDVTQAVKIGANNTLTYKGLFNGANYKPEPSGQSNNGFGANIDMRSWLVLYE